jgi:hypothetical protein
MAFENVHYPAFGNSHPNTNYTMWGLPTKLQSRNVVPAIASAVSSARAEAGLVLGEAI